LIGRVDNSQVIEEFELLKNGFRLLSRTFNNEQLIANGRFISDGRPTQVNIECNAKSTAWRTNAPTEVRVADAELEKRIDQKFKELGLIDNDPPSRKSQSPEAEDAVTVSMCNAAKRMGRQVLERLGSELGVNPRDISLERTEISTGLNVNIAQQKVRQGKICVAVLYTPRGTVQYLVEEVTGSSISGGRQR
jgi:hypothetical protein